MSSTQRVLLGLTILFTFSAASSLIREEATTATVITADAHIAMKADADTEAGAEVKASELRFSHFIGNGSASLVGENSLAADEANGQLACPTECLVCHQYASKHDCVLRMAGAALTDMHAGDGYGNQVWIRDTNTFLEEALESGMNPDSARVILMEFFKLQPVDGGITDWLIMGSDQRQKNTAVTDQEVSLIQAIHKYVVHTNNASILHEKITGYDSRTISVKHRIEMAFKYLRKERLCKKYNLLFRATTCDWGDVIAKVDADRPYLPFYGDPSKTTDPYNGSHSVVLMSGNGHPSIGVYDNAMMVIALHNFADLCHRAGDAVTAKKYHKLAGVWKRRTRKALWDKQRQKWRPHLYLDPMDSGVTGTAAHFRQELGITAAVPVREDANYRAGSPFPATFDEDEIYYHGGTGVAMLAGLNTAAEAKHAYYRMKANAEAAGHAGLTVGLTVWPPYPKTFFPGGMNPYGYQNAGDWPWFGGVIVQGLVSMGQLDEAREALIPMIDRALKHRGFHEWYDYYNMPKGSRHFHGAAGTLSKAIRVLRAAEGVNLCDTCHGH